MHLSKFYAVSALEEVDIFYTAATSGLHVEDGEGQIFKLKISRCGLGK